LKNVVDTSFEEGKAEGKAAGKEERNIEIARQMKAEGAIVIFASVSSCFG
jgi:hypothetical protein